MTSATRDPWLRAVLAVRRGQTATFAELAVAAGRPGAARVAGRVVRERSAERGAPWHRIVPASGRLGDDQLACLRAEGARPRIGESVAAWAARRRAPWVGHIGRRVALPRRDPRAERWPAAALEALPSAVAARARGFVPLDAPEPPAPTPPRGDRRASQSLAQRLAAVDWDRVERDLRRRGLALVRGLLASAECAALAAGFERDALFERTVEMAPRGFGVGEYRYFSEPPPRLVVALRRGLWSRLARRLDPALPARLQDFHALCRAAGQRRGSCILLRYGEGGINHPHRDLYGKVASPLQALVVLSRRGRDFTGGSFYVLDEDGRQHRAPASQGDLVLFLSSRRHGMTPVTRGARYGLGLVMHLAS